MSVRCGLKEEKRRKTMLKGLEKDLLALGELGLGVVDKGEVKDQVISQKEKKKVGSNYYALWPPLQKQQGPQPGSGMKAVFFNGGARRQSNGTGVFLPRRVGAPTEPKKKQNCSTVLLPARVVQALNLNVEEMAAYRPRMSGCYVLGGNDAQMGRSNLKRNQLRHRQSEVLGLSPEICLPREWTY